MIWKYKKVVKVLQRLGLNMMKHWKTKETNDLKVYQNALQQKNIDWNQSQYLNKFLFTDKKFDFS